jgi:mannose-6-phosphate isomerase-like protein (cupin superfamily)
MPPQKINPRDKLARINEHWQPKIVAELNGQHVKLAKLKGEFIWHHHENEDELFLVLAGALRIEFRDGDVELEPGEMIVIPRGVEHRPVADEEAHLRPGTPVGPYTIVEAIASGGMGEAYRAQDSRLGRDVAIKVIGSAPDEERVSRFEREARATAVLKHPNIVTVFDVGTHEGLPFLVSELLEGETLRQILMRCRRIVERRLSASTNGVEAGCSRSAGTGFHERHGQARLGGARSRLRQFT